MAFRSLLLNLILLFTMATHIRSHPNTANPELTFAGVSLPDTASVHASMQFIRDYLDQPTLGHVIRSTVFALMSRSKAVAHDPGSSLARADPEVVAVATLLHDMSWNVSWGPTHQFVTPDKRFEVDGANVARDFLSRLGNDSSSSAVTTSGWDRNRLQLVWDAIALHSTASIGQHKEPEVVLSGYGIYLDVAGLTDENRPLAGIPDEYKVTKEEFDRVYAAVPAPGFTEYLKDIGIGLCLEKPNTTYDNIISSYGVVWVDGFSLAGHTGADALLARAEREGIQNYTDKVPPKQDDDAGKRRA